MPFTDVIDNYANGTTGTLATTTGGSVGYTVTGNASTISRPGTDRGAQINGDGTRTVTVDFDDTVHGMTLSVNRSNPGEEYFIEINGIQIDLNTEIANGTVEFTQGGAATHFITASGGISSTGGPTNGSIGFLHFQSPVDSVRIFGTGASSGNWDLFEIGIDSADFRVVCFDGPTQITTPLGIKRADALKPGDYVTTLDAGPQLILDVTVRKIPALSLSRETKLRPVLIKAGALGGGVPARDLRVSRQHRVLVSSRIAKRVCGSEQVLVPAFQLVGLDGITLDASCEELSYVHILLDNHHVLLANGAPAESLYLGDQAELALSKTNSGIRAAAASMTPARPFPTAQTTRQLISAHKRHDRELLESGFAAAEQETAYKFAAE